MCNEPSEAEMALFNDRCKAVLGDVNNHIWTKKDGTKIHVSKMTTEHITNCINMLERDGFSRVQRPLICVNTSDMSDAAADAVERGMELYWRNPYTPWFRIFEEELRVRGISK